MKHARNLSWIGMGIILACVGGCANHIRSTETVSNEVEQKTLETKYNFILSPDPPNDTSFSVSIEKLEHREVKSFEIKTVKSYSTPYSGWRELYEVPGGIGLLPVSLGAHLVFMLSIGMLPYEVPRTINNLAFTGLNPCLNWESESRVEEELLEANKKILTNYLENLRTPVAKTQILVQAGDFSKNFITDEFGGFTVHFLSLSQDETFFPLSRKVSFSLASDPGKVLKDVFLTREFLSRLLRARARINAYNANPSGKRLMETVIELEKMKFDQLAYSLEESELKKHAGNEKFLDDFKDASQE